MLNNGKTSVEPVSIQTTLNGKSALIEESGDELVVARNNGAATLWTEFDDLFGDSDDADNENNSFFNMSNFFDSSGAFNMNKFFGTGLAISINENVKAKRFDNVTSTDFWSAVNDRKAVSKMDVDRIEFADKKFAFDFFDATAADTASSAMTGNAVKAAKMLGATMGASAVSNPEYTGIVLDFLDANGAYETGIDLLVRAAGAKTNEAVVELLWTNLVGRAPTSEESQPFIDGLNSNLYSVGDLGAAAAELDLNVNNVNLIGLASTGLEYT